MIQFVVITKGATRISEVAARFMLDGLPGRQMAIDADLHAGLIDQHEAAPAPRGGLSPGRLLRRDGRGRQVRPRRRRSRASSSSLVNIGAGLFLGVVNHGMSLGEAVNVFTKLTIGDGLVSQVPAFLISLAAGLIVTRSSSETDLGRDVIGQLFGRPGCSASAAVFLGLLAFTPLPKVPLLALAGGARRCGAVRSGDPARREPAERREPGARSESRRRTPTARRRPDAAARGRRRTGWKTCSTSIRSSWRSATA